MFNSKKERKILHSALDRCARDLCDKLPNDEALESISFSDEFKKKTEKIITKEKYKNNRRKNAISLIAACAVIAIIISVGIINRTSPDDTKQKTVSVIKPKDYTIDTKTDTYSDDELKNAKKNNISPLTIGTFCDIKGLTETSDAVVTGSVISVGYKLADGQIYTVMDLKINKSLKGKFRMGDKITVTRFGGFQKDNDGKLFETRISEDKMPTVKKDDVYLMFLQNSEIQEFKGAYSINSLYYGCYILEKNKFIRHIITNKVARKQNVLDCDKAYKEIKKYTK